MTNRHLCKMKTTNINHALWQDIMSEVRKQNTFFTKSHRIVCLKLIECVTSLVKVLSFDDRNEGYEEYCAFELLKFISYSCREFDIKPTFPKIANEDYLHVIKRLSKGEVNIGTIVLLMAFCLHVSVKMYGDESMLFVLFIERLLKEAENETK